MSSLFQFVILLLLVTDLIMLWSGRILMLIRLSAVQGVLLAALAVNGSRLNTMTRHRTMLRMRFFICFRLLGLEYVGYRAFLSERAAASVAAAAGKAARIA